MALNNLNKPVKISILVTVVLLVGFLLYMLTTRSESVYETDSWHKSYSPSDKGPYGTFVFKELLDTNNIFKNFVKINNTLSEKLVDNEDENDIYLFIGDEYHIDEEDFDVLSSFVVGGNTAIISCVELPDFMLDFFFVDMNKALGTNYDSVQTFKFMHPDLRHKAYNFKHIYNNEVTRYHWTYINKDNFQFLSSDISILGKNGSGDINCINVPFGEGNFIIHTNPYVFTNISMFQNDGFYYAENLIKHTPHGMIQWDAYNLQYHYRYDANGDHEARGNNGSGGNSNRSVFTFLFNHTSLTWAFFLLLATAILYGLFMSKRRQKIIGAAEARENSSLRYIETVSSLYLQERKHNKLIRLQKASFIDFVSNHYFITSHKIDDKYVDRLSQKSGIDKDKIIDLFTDFEALSEQSNVSDNELISLQQKIEYFYKKCK